MRSGVRRAAEDEVPAWLRDALRTESMRHVPRTERMQVRVDRGMEAPSSRRLKRLNGPTLRFSPAMVALGAAVAVTATVLGLSGALLPDQEQAAPVGGDSTVSPATSPPVTGPTKSPPVSPVPVNPNATAQAVAPAPPGKNGFLASVGVVDPHSNQSWTQHNVTLATRLPLNALELTIRVKRTAGVSSTGSWLSLPQSDFTMTVTTAQDVLVYAFKLKPGKTVRPGKYVFAAQFLHNQGRRTTRADTYQAKATALGKPRPPASVRNHF